MARTPLSFGGDTIQPTMSTKLKVSRTGIVLDSHGLSSPDRLCGINLVQQLIRDAVWGASTWSVQLRVRFLVELQKAGLWENIIQEVPPK